ncbi:MAG TPA: hypothetical protein VFH31_18055 [Pyrinomonadaceae bacterium]|nr:hypothetical protein [Pyrinomonadaceae bacterium]
MSSIDIGPITIESSVNFPNISFDVVFVVPDKIPFVGGKKYDLGGSSISLENPSVDLPFSEGPISGDIRFTLDTSHCEFTVAGSLQLKIPEVHTWSWHIGPESVRYMTPFSLTEPSWSVNPVKLDPGTLQSKVNSAPIKSDLGAGQSLRNDTATQNLIRGFFMFAGAEGFVEQSIQSAQWIAGEHSAQITRAAAVGSGTGAAQQTKSVSGPVLIGFALGGTGGAIFGGAGSFGLFFTSDADFGYFGTVALDFGLVAEISVGFTGLVYWPDAGKSAEQNFSGWNGFVAVDAGEGITGGLAIYWPEDAPMSVTSSTPCGVSVSVGPGAGFPVNFVIANSYTLEDVNPPPPVPSH